MNRHHVKTLLILPFFVSLLFAPFVSMAEKSYAERYEKKENKQFRKQEQKSYKEKRAVPEQRGRDIQRSRPSRPSWNDRPERPRPPQYRSYPDRPAYNRPSRPDNYRYSRPHYERPEYKSLPEKHYRTNRRPHKVIVVPSRRIYDRYIVIRPFRYSYPHYRVLRHDDKFWGWLAFTAITLRIIDYLNDQQQREHERALYRATQVPIGTRIIWSDRDDVQGAVTPVWEGPSNYGQFCREFKHEITIDDRTEIAYGTACKTADGYWEVVQ